MHLKINLTDREEVAAGHALLAAILGGALTMPAAGHAVAHTASIYEEFKAAQAADTRAPLGALPQSNEFANAHDGRCKNMEDPAAIFGGAAAPAPLLMPGQTSAPLPSGSVPQPPAVPAPPPANLGPVSSVAPATPAGSVELDTKGLPWDERIHAGSKAKVKDGSWRMKKELDPQLVIAVEAELRARLGNATPVAAPTATTPAPVTTVGASLPITSESQPLAVGQTIMGHPAGPLVVTAMVAADPVTFEQIMPRITAGVTAGILPATAIAQACAANGLPSVVALQTSPQYVPFVWATLKQSYPGLQ